MSIPIITLLVLGLAILWFIVNHILRLTVKIFSCGCISIVILGGAAYIARMLGWI
jgi:hypothetical protein